MELQCQQQNQDKPQSAFCMKLSRFEWTFMVLPEALYNCAFHRLCIPVSFCDLGNTKSLYLKASVTELQVGIQNCCQGGADSKSWSWILGAQIQHLRQDTFFPEKCVQRKNEKKLYIGSEISDPWANCIHHWTCVLAGNLRRHASWFYWLHSTEGAPCSHYRFRTAE